MSVKLDALLAHVQAMKATIVRTENGVKIRRCFWCDREGLMTRDHVVPLALDGDNQWHNIVPACLTCQRERERLLQLAINAKRLRKHAARGGEYVSHRSFMASVEKQRRSQAKLKAEMERWVAIEMERWGSSPTLEFDLNLPMIPDPERERQPLPPPLAWELQ